MRSGRNAYVGLFAQMELCVTVIDSLLENLFETPLNFFWFTIKLTLHFTHFGNLREKSGN